jgi:hypothetical protein
MIVIPAILAKPKARVYADSDDPGASYLDVLQPAPARGDAVARWMLIPPDAAYLAGEVRFGPDTADFKTLPAGTSRALPLPWASGPVFVWCREGDGVRLLARGKTSGYGMSNAVFSASAPATTMIAPLAIAAEPSCRARLAGARVRGTVALEALQRALARAPIGGRAEWSATLADSLLHVLRGLLDRGDAELAIEGRGLSREGAGELRELALLEWAQRIRTASAGPPESLAFPAGQVARVEPHGARDLRLAWDDGAIVPLRVVRVLKVARAL